jgi:hypothetical protein
MRRDRRDKRLEGMKDKGWIRRKSVGWGGSDYSLPASLPLADPIFWNDRGGKSSHPSTKIGFGLHVT